MAILPPPLPGGSPMGLQAPMAPALGGPVPMAQATIPAAPPNPQALMQTLFGSSGKIGRGGPGSKRRMRFRKPKPPGRFK
jgi:hypothetical protein